MVWRTAAAAATSDTVAAAVPGLHFGLQRVESPARNGIVVEFSLPDGAAARLDVMDVLGRRVLTRDLSTMGAGDHTLALAAPGSLAPGVYLVRLQHGQDRRVTRVALLH